MKLDLWIWEDLKWFTHNVQCIRASLEVCTEQTFLRSVLIMEYYCCTLNKEGKGADWEKKNEWSRPRLYLTAGVFSSSHWRHSKSPLFLYWNCLKQWWRTIARFSQEQQPQLQGRGPKSFSHGFHPIPSFIWGKKKADTLFSLCFLNWFGNHEIAMWYQSQNKTGCFTFSLFNSWVRGQ